VYLLLLASKHANEYVIQFHVQHTSCPKRGGGKRLRETGPALYPFAWCAGRRCRGGFAAGARGRGLLVMSHVIQNGWKSTAFVVLQDLWGGARGGAAGHESCYPKRLEKHCIRGAKMYYRITGVVRGGHATLRETGRLYIGLLGVRTSV